MTKHKPDNSDKDEKNIKLNNQLDSDFVDSNQVDLEHRWHGDSSDFIVTTLEDALERKCRSSEERKQHLEKLRKKNEKSYEISKKIDD